MNEIRTHKDLEAWKQSITLVKEIYALCIHFPATEKYGLASQIRRCAVSIPSNIAEGAARKGHKEFIQFLYIALGSLSELETQLIISKELEIVAIDIKLESRITNIRRMIFGLIKYFNKN